MTNYYNDLGISPSAKYSEIKMALENKKIQLHVLNARGSLAYDQLQKGLECLEIIDQTLKNPIKRASYNKQQGLPMVNALGLKINDKKFMALTGTSLVLMSFLYGCSKDNDTIEQSDLPTTSTIQPNISNDQIVGGVEENILIPEDEKIEEEKEINQNLQPVTPSVNDNLESENIQNKPTNVKLTNAEYIEQFNTRYQELLNVFKNNRAIDLDFENPNPALNEMEAELTNFNVNSRNIYQMLLLSNISYLPEEVLAELGIYDLNMIATFWMVGQNAIFKVTDYNHHNQNQYTGLSDFILDPLQQQLVKSVEETNQSVYVITNSNASNTEKTQAVENAVTTYAAMIDCSEPITTISGKEYYVTSLANDFSNILFRGEISLLNTVNSNYKSDATKSAIIKIENWDDIPTVFWEENYVHETCETLTK